MLWNLLWLKKNTKTTKRKNSKIVFSFVCFFSERMDKSKLQVNVNLSNFCSFYVTTRHVFYTAICELLVSIPKLTYGIIAAVKTTTYTKPNWKPWQSIHKMIKWICASTNDKRRPTWQHKEHELSNYILCINSSTIWYRNYEWICAWKLCHHLWACWSCVWPGTGPRLWFLRKKGTVAPNTLTFEYYRRSFSARRPSTRPTMQSGQFALLQLMLCNVPLDLLVSESRVAARSLERNRWVTGSGPLPELELSCRKVRNVFSCSGTEGWVEEVLRARLLVL